MLGKKGAQHAFSYLFYLASGELCRARKSGRHGKFEAEPNPSLSH